MTPEERTVARKTAEAAAMALLSTIDRLEADLVAAKKRVEELEWIIKGLRK